MINLFKVFVPESVDKPLLEVLHSGYIGQGVQVDKFEDKIADFLNMPHNKHVVTVNAGTTGLHMALKLANIKRGDEVISTPMTCFATNAPIIHSGAKIVWADINPNDGNIDPNDIEHLITAKTKAIMIVDWGGNPCSYDEINSIAREHGLLVIEDAAQAFGAEYEGRKIGAFSDYTEFSLQAIKTITSIDGGILVCKRKQDRDRGVLLRWFGMDRTKSREVRCLNDVPEAGFKWHMNDISAVLGVESMKYIDRNLRKQRGNADYYDMKLRKWKITKCTPLKRSKKKLSSHWLYTLLVDDRDGFIEFMEKNGIHASRAHVRNDTYGCLKQSKGRKLPGVDYFDSHQVNIPVGWWVTLEDRRYIMEAIEKWDKKK